MDMKVWLGGDGSYVEFNNGAKSIVLSGVTMAAGNTALADAEVITFGDASDFSLGFDGTQLEFLPVTDDTGAVNIGDGTKDADFKVFLGTTSAYFQCDVGNGQVNIEGAELHLGDNDLVEFGDATAGDVTLGWNASNLVFLPAADDTGAIVIGDGSTPKDMDFKVFLGAAGSYFECNRGDGQVNIEGGELHLGDNDLIEFGDATAGDVTLGWNASNLVFLPAADDTGAVIIGDGSTPKDIDFKVFLGASGSYFECNRGDGQVNIEGGELHLGDNDLIEFGDATAGDFTLGFNASNLVVLPAADDTGAVVIGDGSTPKDVDFKVFLGAAGSYFECERGEGQVNIEGAELHLGDGDKLEFGDGAGGDVTIDWNSAQLNILALADDEIIKFGNGTNSFDIWTYGNTATDYILCDAGANKQSFVGEYFPAMKTPVAITGNATLNATHFGALVQSNGAANTDILTLPDAAADNAGAWIYAQRIADFGWTVATNTADTLVGVNNASADSVTFNTANEKIGSCGLFVSDGALWHFFPSAGTYTLNDA